MIYKISPNFRIKIRKQTLLEGFGQKQDRQFLQRIHTVFHSDRPTSELLNLMQPEDFLVLWSRSSNSGYIWVVYNNRFIPQYLQIIKKPDLWSSITDT